MKVSLSELEVQRAKRGVAQSLANLRTCGTVEILQDIFGFAAVVCLTPLTPRDGTFDTEDWAAVREPTEMLVDPLGIIERAQRDGP